MIFRNAAVLLALALLTACGGGATNRAAPVSTGAGVAPSAVQSNCLAAVANEVGVGDVSFIRSDVSEGDGLTNVYVNVPGAQAPWVCRATANGSVVDVMYTGSEGAL